MCSLNDDDGEDILLASRASVSTIQKVCRSCENSAQVILRKKDAYCRSCFLNSSTHKFRSTLGKSKMLKAGDRILVFFSGNHSSVALAHLIRAGLNEESNKRLIFDVDLLYIDDGLVLGENAERRMEIARQVKEVAESFSFNIFITTLSEIFSGSIQVGKNLELCEDLEEELQKLFGSVNTVTAKEDLLYQLKHKLIVKVADSMEYKKVFTDEVGTDLAVKLLAGISLGRGSQMAAEVGFCDNRYITIPVLRPLKDFTQKEIVFYNIFHALKPIKTQSLTTLLPTDASILKTTESFVNQLQEDFPSTVYTIFRTGDKLKTNENVTNKEDKNCALCNRIISVTSSDGCDVPKSLEFSNKISQLNGCGNEGITSCACSKSSMFQVEVSNYFCYGCSLIFKDMDNKDDFQNYLIANARREKNMQELKSQISEFLIE